MGKAEERPDWAEIFAGMQPGTSHWHDLTDEMDELEEMLRVAHGTVDVVLEDPKINATALGAGAVVLCELILHLGAPFAFTHRGRRFRLASTSRPWISARRMMSVFIPQEAVMVRRTVSLPEALDARVRAAAEEGESYSAAVSRLLDAGLAVTEGATRPAWIGSGEGPGDLGRRAEEYLRDPVRSG
jgi:hypothetical protein